MNTRDASPENLIRATYELLLSANSMSTRHEGCSDARWSDQTDGVYGGLYDALERACREFYGVELTDVIFERVLLNGDDWDDIVANARRIFSDRQVVVECPVCGRFQYSAYSAIKDSQCDECGHPRMEENTNETARCVETGLIRSAR